MYNIWEKKSQEEIKSVVFNALKENINYTEQYGFGIPASHLDSKVFSQDETFIKEAPFISTLVHNPNHIGCHTLGESESYFKGTQAIERELIELCASDILKGEISMQDGYVASGGTEANMQAIWIYRNYFLQEHSANRDEICIVCSEDRHYSMDKAADIFAIDIFKVPVEDDTRELTINNVNEVLKEAKANGKKYFIVVCNMMCTMFGAVDNIKNYVDALKENGCEYKIHVDGAFGGFYYPFTDDENLLTFKNPNITSFTLDAHKMAQAPYGTGIFLIRKGFMQYSNSKAASYVEGLDCTIIGSRSGANAIAVWMILMKNGPFGWQEKIYILQKRTKWICDHLNELQVKFYRNSKSNIIAIRSEYIEKQVAQEFSLVPDNHVNPKWYKIVVMEHVTIDKAIILLSRIKQKIGQDIN